MGQEEPDSGKIVAYQVQVGVNPSTLKSKIFVAYSSTLLPNVAALFFLYPANTFLFSITKL